MVKVLVAVILALAGFYGVASIAIPLYHAVNQSIAHVAESR
jgi:hypothetical protein